MQPDRTRPVPVLIVNSGRAVIGEGAVHTCRNFPDQSSTNSAASSVGKSSDAPQGQGHRRPESRSRRGVLVNNSCPRPPPSTPVPLPPGPQRGPIPCVLSDPKRLRTPCGHGYLVSWKHRLRTRSTVVRLEVDRIAARDRPDRAAPATDAVRITVPYETNVLELGFTVSPSATDTLLADGPAGTHGRYLLDFIHRPVLVEQDGEETVVPLSEGNTFAATGGALLRK